MMTTAELALLRAADPKAVLPGIDTPTGNQTAASQLTSYTSITTNPSAPFYYVPSLNEVIVKQDGAVLSGYNFGTAGVMLLANDVTIKNSTFSGTTGLYSVWQPVGYTGATVTGDTFTGGSLSNPLPLSAFIGSETSVNILGNRFINAPADACDIRGGTVTGNYFSGAGFSTLGEHPDAIWVTDSYAPTQISNNFIDWTWSDGAMTNAPMTGSDNDAIRITVEQGSVSNVSVTGNYLLGGSSTVDAGNAGDKGVFSNINVSNNMIGFGQYHDFMVGPQTGVTETGNTIFDYTNPAYSAKAWAAYLASGIATNNLVVATSAGDDITGLASGSTTLYGAGTAEHLYGTANETVFVGGYGTQYMWGGSGTNIFKYLSIADSTANGGEDLIGNFHVAKDVVDLSAIDSNLGAAGTQGFTFIGAAAFSGGGGQVRYVLDKANDQTDVEADLVGDSEPDLVIRLSGLLNLTAANFALGATGAQSASAIHPSAVAAPAAHDFGNAATISLAMSEAVGVSGAPVLLLNDGAKAFYDSARSTTTNLVFDYTAGTESSTGLAVEGVKLRGGASIGNRAGIAVDLSSADVDATGSAPVAIAVGKFTIAGGGNIDIFAPSSAKVTFAPGATGELTLAHSQSFVGRIAGFAPGASIDLADILYGSGTSTNYTENASLTRGMLTINDGAHAADIALLGSYLTANFATSNDGHGGTLVAEVPALSLVHSVLAPAHL